jgi:hypothetical protein
MTSTMDWSRNLPSVTKTRRNQVWVTKFAKMSTKVSENYEKSFKLNFSRNMQSLESTQCSFKFLWCPLTKNAKVFLKMQGDDCAIQCPAVSYRNGVFWNWSLKYVCSILYLIIFLIFFSREQYLVPPDNQPYNLSGHWEL